MPTSNFTTDDRTEIDKVQSDITKNTSEISNNRSSILSFDPNSFVKDNLKDFVNVGGGITLDASDMTMDIELTIVYVLGKRVEVSDTNNIVSFNTNTSGNDRIDLVSIHKENGIIITEGVPDPSPSVPSVPTNSLPLFEVTIPDGSTDLSTSTLSKDRRRYLSSGTFLPSVGRDGEFFRLIAQDGANPIGTYEWHTSQWNVILATVAWNDITGKPATFTPTAHNHNASDINAGTLPQTRGGTGQVSWTASRVVEISGAGNLQASSITTTELGYLDGVSSNIQTQFTGKQSTSEKAQANGYASLDGGGKIPTAQLPSYVHDVEEYANEGAFPVTGASNIIYLAADTNDSYRWTGSQYVKISGKVDAVDGQTGNVDLSGVYLGIGDKAVDSDLLDGVNGSDYKKRAIDFSDWNSFTQAKFCTYSSSTNGPSGGTTFFGAYFPHASSNYGFQIAGRIDDAYIRCQELGVWRSWYKLWNANNFDPASKLGVSAQAADSDTLDGFHAAAFLRLSIANLISANQTWLDGNAVNLGTDSDAQIYHSGSHLYFENSTGDFRLRAKGSSLFRISVGNSYLDVFTAQNGQATKIFHGDGQIRFETVAGGGSKHTGRLESTGGINLGNTSDTTNGNLRHTGTDIEAYKNGAWVSLTVQGGDSVLSIPPTDLDLSGLDAGAITSEYYHIGMNYLVVGSGDDKIGIYDRTKDLWNWVTLTSKTYQPLSVCVDEGRGYVWVTGTGGTNDTNFDSHYIVKINLQSASIEKTIDLETASTLVDDPLDEFRGSSRMINKQTDSHVLVCFPYQADTAQYSSLIMKVNKDTNVVDNELELDIQGASSKYNAAYDLIVYDDFVYVTRGLYFNVSWSHRTQITKLNLDDLSVVGHVSIYDIDSNTRAMLKFTQAGDKLYLATASDSQSLGAVVKFDPKVTFDSNAFTVYTLPATHDHIGWDIGPYDGRYIWMGNIWPEIREFIRFDTQTNSFEIIDYDEITSIANNGTIKFSTYREGKIWGMMNRNNNSQTSHLFYFDPSQVTPNP